jgi:hypothetical protein
LQHNVVRGEPDILEENINFTFRVKEAVSGIHGIITPKIAPFIVAAMKTSKTT